MWPFTRKQLKTTVFDIPQAAKMQSEDQLRSLNVLVNPNLPVIEAPSDLAPRSPSAVAGRAFVLSYVVGIGYGRSGSEMLARIQEFGIAAHLSPLERDFLAQASYSESDTAWASWLGEAAQSLAWALGYVELHPLRLSSDELAAHFLSPEIVPLQQIESATLRPFDQLYAQADLHYRLHWAARQARLARKPFPQPETCIEMRRRSLDWIIGAPNEWDDIPSDT